jgi:hypothetical protein
MFPFINLSIWSLFRVLARNSDFILSHEGLFWFELMVIVKQEEGYSVRILGLRGTLMGASSVLAPYKRYAQVEACDRFVIHTPIGGGRAPTRSSSVAMKVPRGSNERVVRNREQLEVLQLLKRGGVSQN